MADPLLLALPRQIPSPSFVSSVTLVKPASSIVDLACPSVKLLRPATGALELFWPALLTALLFGPDCEGGFCAEAGVAISSPIEAKRNERFPKLRSARNLSQWQLFLNLAAARAAGLCSLWTFGDAGLTLHA